MRPPINAESEIKVHPGISYHYWFSFKVRLRVTPFSMHMCVCAGQHDLICIGKRTKWNVFWVFSTPIVTVTITLLYSLYWSPVLISIDDITSDNILYIVTLWFKQGSQMWILFNCGRWDLLWLLTELIFWKSTDFFLWLGVKWKEIDL